ncbi:amino acid adenylation domain-containing protein [Umezawaea sp. Da 62-37]|uniref:non-ribosomal peptide synthetase n=1 Tax=Umezawaea sp. Da 62-37 TaxID=3075927 RepID=UPI0028F6DEC8|nr:amino acid adenylation domain-containing protein [Umezawaea sp. Da 62-37]WNV85207.1 amino acid adenylation domain-containing protein [Umezawaea sp. Da 62-37]
MTPSECVETFPDRDGVGRWYPADRTLPDLFAERVHRHGDELAVRSAAGTLTYRELHDRADRMAAYLTTSGVRRGDRVCVITRPGPCAVEVFVAVARIGACLISLEPDVPPQRLRVILDDCRPVLVLLTDPADCFDTGEVPTHDIGSLPAVAAPTRWEAPVPDDPLCCVYTSGSTGRPKGVVLSHRGLVNLVSWHRDTFGSAEGKRHGQVASLSFDASLWEIWSTLCLGGCLCVADPELRRDPRALSWWMIREGLSLCFLTTVTAHRMLTSGTLAGAFDLRFLLVGGDRLAATPGTFPFTLVNVYGPTEASVFATWWRHDGSAPPPIGHPLHNVRAHVLDRHLRPLPVDRVGELYLAGEGLAHGYLGAMGPTASRFVADPFGPPGTRMYRTGDLVSRNAHGALTFHGRVDRQVKVRGTRVELDEVELVIAQHHQIAEAAVVCDGGPAGDPFVMAYITVAPTQDVDLAELRTWLRDRLPPAMMPSRITRLPTMPMTVSGKTDRRALAQHPPQTSTRPGERPRTDAEQTVQAQWAAVLDGRLVGIHEKFFDAGGSSIRLLELRWRLERLCGGTVSVAQLFEHTTIAAMARLVESVHPARVTDDDFEL